MILHFYIELLKNIDFYPNYGLLIVKYLITGFVLLLIHMCYSIKYYGNKKKKIFFGFRKKFGKNTLKFIIIYVYNG